MHEATGVLTGPPITHVIYIPFVLLVGIIIGFLLGRRAGIKEGKARLIGAGPDDEED
jgi:hypothetical protein